MNITTKYLNWKNNQLYYGQEFTGTYLRPHQDYPNLFYISTKLGETDDFYNISRAKQHAELLTTEDANKTTKP